MSGSVGTKLVVVGAAVLVVASASTASVSWAVFVDAETVSGSVSAASDFGYRGEGPCIDTNDDWECTREDEPVSRRDVNTFSNATATLVIPESTGPVHNRTIDIQADGFRTAVDVGSRNGNGVSIQTGSNRLVVDGVRINSSSGDVSLGTTGGDVVLRGSDLESDTGTISVAPAGDLAASEVAVDTRGEVSLSGADVTLTDADLTGDYGGVTVKADGRLTLDGASVTAASTVSLSGQNVSAARTSRGPARVETSDGAGINLAATAGDGGSVAAPGVELVSDGSLDVSAADSVDLAESTLRADTGGTTVGVSGRSVTVANATVVTGGTVSVTSGGLDADGATVDADGAVTLSAADRGAGPLSAVGAEVTTAYGEITVTAGTEATVIGARLRSNSAVTVSATDGPGGPVNADGINVTTADGQITFAGSTETTLRDASITSNAAVSVTAADNGGGPIDATGAEVHTDYGTVEFESIGNITLEDAAITTESGDTKAELNEPAHAIHYDGVVVADPDDTLRYSPAGAAENGTASTGAVEPR